MTLLYLTLLVTTIAMMAVLTLVFFAARLRSLLKAHLYHRTFSFFAVLAVAGMLLAGLLSFNIPNNNEISAVAANRSSGR